jgi:hypothetical protein
MKLLRIPPSALAAVVLLCAIAGLVQPLTAQRAPATLPRVHFVATGGTISNRDGGRLSADLGTLQADPESEAGIAYLAEAVQLFGSGAVPAESDTTATASGTDAVPTLLIGATVILGLILVTAFALRART